MSKVGALIGFLCCYLLPVVFLLVSRVLERRRCLNRLIFMIALRLESLGFCWKVKKMVKNKNKNCFYFYVRE